jgi:hypothetical protein
MAASDANDLDGASEAPPIGSSFRERAPASLAFQ